MFRRVLFRSKQNLLSVAFLSSLTITGYAQNSKPAVDPNENFSESEVVLFSCDFQDADEVPMKFTTADLDGLTPTAEMQSLGFAVQSHSTDYWVTWVPSLRDSYESTNYFIGSTSAYTPAGQANDWLMTIPVQIPGKNVVLRWKSEALYANKRDGLKVFVTRTGIADPANFTEEPIFSVEEEEAGPTENLDGEWIQHEVSLSDFDGETICVAFVNQSYDKSLICLDDIEIVYSTPYKVALDVPQYTDQEELIVSGQLVSQSDKTITAYDIHFAFDNQEIGRAHV